MPHELNPANDLLAYNRAAWDRLVQLKNQWTVPVTPEQIQRARVGDWQIVLTPTKAVPRDWFPDFGSGTIKVLCLPYSDLASLSPQQKQKLINADEPFVFGHTLEDQISGQIKAGLAITGFYEDRWSERPLSKFISTSLATKSTKLPKLD